MIDTDSPHSETHDSRTAAVRALDDVAPYSTTADVARIFHVSMRTVDRWTSDGRLRAVRVRPGGGTSRRLYPRPELQRFVASLEGELPR